MGRFLIFERFFADEQQPFAPALGPPIAPGDTLALLDTTGEVRPLDEIEAEISPVRDYSHYRGQIVGSGAAAANRPLDPLLGKLEALGMTTEQAPRRAKQRKAGA